MAGFVNGTVPLVWVSQVYNWLTVVRYLLCSAAKVLASADGSRPVLMMA